MVVSKGGTDVFVDLKASIFCEKGDFGRRERVVLWELQYSVIEASCKIFFKSKKAEVIEEERFFDDYGLGYRVILNRLLFLL